MKTFFKKHCWGFIFALLVGLILVSPPLLARHALGSQYAGIPFMYVGDEDTYLERIQEILDGHGWLASPYFYEYKNSPALIFPTGEFLYALPSLLFKISPTLILLAGKFVMPAILFFLVYLVVYELTVSDQEWSKKLQAIATGSLVILGYDFADYSYAWSVLNGHYQGINLSLWTRPVNPIVGAILLFILVLILSKMMQKKMRFGYLFAGLALGLMTGYFFSWAVSMVIVGILVLISFFRKNYSLVKQLLLSIAISFVVSLPYWYKMVSLFSAPDGQTASQRQGMLFGHTPIFNKAVFAATVLFLGLTFFQYCKEKSFRSLWQSHWWILCASFLGASWVVFNQQVITGRSIWPYHFVQYTIPLSMVVVMICFFNVLRSRIPKIFLVVTTGIIGISFGYGIVSARSYRYVSDDFADRQHYQPVLSWLNNNTPKDCVVLASELQNELLNRLIPAFTHCDMYTTFWTYSGVPMERIYHNYFVLLRLQGVESSQIKPYLNEHRIDVKHYFYENWEQLYGKVSDDWYVSRINKLVDDYEQFTKKDFITELKKFRLSYVILDKTASTTPQFHTWFKNKPVFSDNRFEVYSFE